MDETDRIVDIIILFLPIQQDGTGHRIESKENIVIQDRLLIASIDDVIIQVIIEPPLAELTRTVFKCVQVQFLIQEVLKIQYGLLHSLSLDVFELTLADLTGQKEFKVLCTFIHLVCHP